MKSFKLVALIGVGALLGACSEVGANKSIDLGPIDAKPVNQLIASIWVDPNGCDHWFIDDGIEGYLSPRLSANGQPVCSGVARANTVAGPVLPSMPLTVSRPGMIVQ